MSSEFNPTKKDLALIDGRLLDIKSKKNKLVNTKMSLQNALGILKDNYKDIDLNSAEFKEIKQTRNQTKAHLNSIELQIRSLNEELVVKNKLRIEIEFHLKHNRQIESKEDIDKLLIKLKALKNKYSDFAKDRTRISSLRVMANEFIEDIDALVKIAS